MAGPTRQEYSMLRLQHIFEEADDAPLRPRDVQLLFEDLAHESDAVVFGAALESEDAYWRGWADAVVTVRAAWTPAIVTYPPAHDQHIYRINYGSPFSVESFLNVPKELVVLVKDTFVKVYKRYIFVDEERRRLQITNEILKEQRNAAQLDNIEKIFNLAERFGSDETRAAITNDLARRLGGMHSHLAPPNETKQYRKLQLTQADVTEHSEEDE